MIKRAALIFGWVFLLVGIIGFIPALRMGGGGDGYLLGLFAVNSVHNWVHILTGAAALATGYRSEAASKLYFKIFGIVYVLVALLGFVYGNSPLLGIMAHNMIDAVFHLVIAVVALYLGFATRRWVQQERAA